MNLPNNLAEYKALLLETSENGGFPCYKTESEDDRTCLYRGEDGKKCAIGLLIPKEKYNYEMEKYGGINTNHLVRDILPEWLEVDMAKNIQWAHDSVVVDANYSGGWDKEKFKNEIERIFSNQE